MQSSVLSALILAVTFSCGCYSYRILSTLDDISPIYIESRDYVIDHLRSSSANESRQLEGSPDPDDGGDPDGSETIKRLLRKFLGSYRKRGSNDAELSSSEEDDMLEKHNDLRAGLGASNMYALTWSDELAEKAQELSDSCRMDHGLLQWEGSTYPRVGQNMYIGSKRDIDGAIQNWYNEKKDYRYGRGCKSNKVCGHYTQLAWAQTKEMGCGVSYCERAPSESFSTTFKDSYIITCNYGPAGNFKGRLPFLEGDGCSFCEGGSSWCKDEALCSMKKCKGCDCDLECENGSLDRSSCSCECDDGFVGPTCEDPCEDRDPMCGPLNGWGPETCTNSAFPDPFEKCPLMCKRCVPEGGDICKDKHKYCNANPGWNESWCDRDYVKFECPKMCGICS